MEHQEMEEDGRLCIKSEGVTSMEEDNGPVGMGVGGMGMGGRDSPLKPDMSMVEGEDILAKLKEQVSSATTTLLPPSAALPPPTHSPSHNLNNNHNSTNNNNANNNNNNNSVHSIYDRLHTLLQAKKKTEEDGDGEEDSRDLVLRAEALHRQRESLLSSPQALMNAMRGGGPPSLVPPGPHLPFIPSTVGLPPTTQMPPTPGSAGSRDSSGNGARTPSHTPEPHQSQQSWSFEEQFKQVREPTKHSSFEEDKRKLYELDDDVKRKDFLDELFSFMQKRGTPINRLPIMAKQVLDLYELYKLVVERGGLVDVINKKLWQEIIKGLKLPSSITSAAFTLRTQYTKYLYPYECEKTKLSTPAELQAAIDNNRREGRRSSYGSYVDAVQPPLLSLQSLQGLHSPLALANSHFNGGGTISPLPQPDGLLGRGGSPPGSQEALLEATRLTMWKLYNQGLGVGGGFQHEDDGPKLPPPHHPLAGVAFPPQKEALNLEVKDEEVPLFHDNRGYQPFCLQRTGRLKDAVDHRNDLRNDVRNDLRNDLRNELRNDIRNEFRNDVRSRLEEAAIPPSAKRPAQQDDSHDSRLPPPTTPTPPTPPGYPGANIKITSRGGRGQDQSMVVSMEVNGIMYQGVLFAQAPRARFS